MSNDPDAKKKVIEVLIAHIDAKMARMQSARDMLVGRLAEFEPMTTDAQELRLVEEMINEAD